MEKIKYKQIKESMSKNPVISVIIRCLNEEKYIRQCIRMIQKQEIDLEFEIIVIDSGSYDNTVGIARDFDLSLYEIASCDFNFGTSINLGIELARGQYCVFLSAHAIPYDKNWLKELVYPLLKNNKLAASYSKQIYYDYTFILEKRSLENTFGNEERLQKIDNSDKKTFNNIKSEIIFSNASSCIRKTVAIEFPFKKICASEDREWALRVLTAGYEILYVPKSKIYHAHNESVQQWYKRIYINSKALYQFAGVKISIFHVIPLFLVQIFKDIKFSFSQKIKINLNTIKIFIVYEFYYVLAHYKSTRE